MLCDRILNATWHSQASLRDSMPPDARRIDDAARAANDPALSQEQFDHWLAENGFTKAQAKTFFDAHRRQREALASCDGKQAFLSATTLRSLSIAPHCWIRLLAPSGSPSPARS